MKRTIFAAEHDAFRDAVRAFVTKEVVPEFPRWEKQGYADHDFYGKLARLGPTGFDVPEEYGGTGEISYKYQVILTEEAARQGVGLGNFAVSWGIVLPYLLNLATDEQKKRWLPGVAAGETMLAIAMTEPGTGSDLAGIKSTARLDGNHYLLNGAKTFITGASQADLMVVVARTSPPSPHNRRTGLSLLVVDTKAEGFQVGKRLEKIGLKSSDTCELAFTDVRVPVDDLLGEEGQAFSYLGQNLPRERLAIGVGACASAAAAIALTRDYVKEREVFDRPVASFQNTKFVLAECATELEAAQAMVDKGIELDDAGELSGPDAAKIKLFGTEMAGRVIDKCLQLHGGYGYILEYPIARLYADIRVNRIYGGTNEVMKTIIAKSMGL
ncbi:MAG TPA: acyl-CoA dehydrogenase family protein [Jatrophihabitans sp.]|nr:acyl-CoA dehydrogenase family protein [Jatrophihabitans sp.]